MINKKICMLGSLAVGKSALIQQFVHSIFSDNYLSSVGVKISKKPVTVETQPVTLMLWDLEGHDDYGEVNVSYVKGASGLLLVVDGTRGETLQVALNLRKTTLDMLGADTPHLLLFNKSDLKDQWEITDKVLDSLRNNGLEVLLTSAKTGLNVELAFATLAERMMDRAR